MPKTTKKEKTLRKLAKDIAVQPWQPKKPKAPLQQRVRRHVQHNFRRSLERLSNALDTADTFADKVLLYSSDVEKLSNRDDADALKNAIKAFREAVTLPEPSEEDRTLDPRISAKLDTILGISED
jgi:hypothetical protein